MVKAYLKYVSQDNLGGLASNTANLQVAQISKDGKDSSFVVSACNETVNLVNAVTKEIEYKIYDSQAEHGFVTCLKVSGQLLAVGFSNGTVLVYDLDLEKRVPHVDHQDRLEFAEVHKF